MNLTQMGQWHNMNNYTTDARTEGTAKNNIKAAIFNANKEIDILKAVEKLSGAYTGQFNKRYETYMEKGLAAAFGTYHYESDYSAEQSRDINNVRLSMQKRDYGMGVSYSIALHYQGQESGWSHDKKMNELRDKYMSFDFYSTEKAQDVTDACAGYIKYRTESIDKLKSNLTKIKGLMSEHDKLVAAVEAYNNKISYAVTDILRIK